MENLGKRMMDYLTIYSVKDVADLLEVNKETVRRWIRSGKLKARIYYNKKGYRIYRKDLIEFVNNKTKYKTIFENKYRDFETEHSILAAFGTIGVIADSLLMRDYKDHIRELKEE